MGTASVQGDLWGRAPVDWASLQEVHHAPLWEAMLDSVGAGPGTSLLDAGCGGGGACVLAARRGASVSGLDASAPLIDVARRRMPDADFRVGDLEALPFDDGSFDAVIAASSIQYAEDRVAALAELARVTAGGHVSVGLFSTADKVDLGAVFDAVASVLPEKPGGGGPFELSAPGVLEDLVERAGMGVVEAGEADCPFDYPDDETFWLAMVSGGPFQAAIGEVGEDVVKGAVMAAVEPYRTADGGFRLDNAFRYVTARPGA